LFKRTNAVVAAVRAGPKLAHPAGTNRSPGDMRRFPATKGAAMSGPRPRSSRSAWRVRSPGRDASETEHPEGTRPDRARILRSAVQNR